MNLLTNIYLSSNYYNITKRRLFSKLKINVDIFVEQFRKLPDHLILDVEYMEKFIIEVIGLNDEILNEQPKELSDYFGKGLYIWQYPKQFAKYIVWLAKNCINYSNYLEIGCRWGGGYLLWFAKYYIK